MVNKEKVFYVAFILIVLGAIGVGLYPLGYISPNIRNNGLLATKSKQLIASNGYMTAFYIHISLGGLALLTGWSQFIQSWRNKHLRFHRYLGYVYIVCVFLSSVAGFIISFFSTGGVVGAVGFAILALLWNSTVVMGLFHIKRGLVKNHRKWMIRNYALTLSALTLRIYLGIMTASGADIVLILQVTGWLCWIPNLILAELYIQTQLNKPNSSSLIKIRDQKSSPECIVPA